MLVDVYHNVLQELVALDDPELQPFIHEVNQLYGNALFELHMQQRAAVRAHDDTLLLRPAPPSPLSRRLHHVA